MTLLGFIFLWFIWFLFWLYLLSTIQTPSAWTSKRLNVIVTFSDYVQTLPLLVPKNQSDFSLSCDVNMAFASADCRLLIEFIWSRDFSSSSSLLTLRLKCLPNWNPVRSLVCQRQLRLEWVFSPNPFSQGGHKVVLEAMSEKWWADLLNFHYYSCRISDIQQSWFIIRHVWLTEWLGVVFWATHSYII